MFGNSKKIDWRNTKYSELTKIRQVRNETVGHPIKTERRGGNSSYINDEITSCTIDRSSLTKDGFRYMLWMHSRTESKIIKKIRKGLEDRYGKFGETLRIPGTE